MCTQLTKSLVDLAQIGHPEFAAFELLLAGLKLVGPLLELVALRLQLGFELDELGVVALGAARLEEQLLPVGVALPAQSAHLLERLGLVRVRRGHQHVRAQHYARHLDDLRVSTFRNYARVLRGQTVERDLALDFWWDRWECLLQY